MSKALRILGGVWIGTISVFTILLIGQDVTETSFQFDYFRPLLLLGIALLLLWPGIFLVRLADRLQNPSAVIPMTLCSEPAVGYFRQHWQGEHSLARGIWVNTVLLLFTFYGVWRFLYNYSTDLGVAIYDAPILHTICFDIIPWGVFLVLVSWQLVGLLRAAQRRIKVGSSFWSWDHARVIQEFVGIAFLAVFYPLVFHALPDVYSGATIILEAIGDDKYTVTVRNGGTELEIRGGMRFGLTEEVKRSLDMNPRIKVIHLNSSGGRALEGEGLFNLIRERQLITYSSIVCGSACALAFIGGTKRYLNKHARLGFHQSYTDSGISLGIDREDAPTVYNAYKDVIRRETLYYIEAGVDRNFVEKLFSALTYAMTYPPPDELLRAGVVHGLTNRVDLVLP